MVSPVLHDIDDEFEPDPRTVSAHEFLYLPRGANSRQHTAISLFSGGGLSDLGYEQAGFEFLVQVEADERRANFCKDNFPRSLVISEKVEDVATEIAGQYRERTTENLDLLIVTPPCQGMSSTNPARGNVNDHGDDEANSRNSLLLSSIPVIHALDPRIVVVENVSNALKKKVSRERGGTRETGLLVDFFEEAIPDYYLFKSVVQMADYGIPQERRRSFIVGVRRDQPWLQALWTTHRAPWPQATHVDALNNGHRPWLTLRDWLERIDYPALDAQTAETARDLDYHSLHYVPDYEDEPFRYTWIADIPPYSGQSAYLNNCHHCGEEIPEGRIRCGRCRHYLTNRPYVQKGKKFRLIKGYRTAYRRMWPDRPASTVTTATSHLGSNYTIHPWENRVMSILECADLQTVPRYYDWDRAEREQISYLVRQIVGEALPSYFTYKHGLLLRQLLGNEEVDPDALALWEGEPAEQVRLLGLE